MPQRALRGRDLPVTRPRTVPPAAVALAALLVAAAAGGGRAWADAYEATLTRAIAAKERAMDVNEPTRWEEALRLFQEADALRATRETKYELGYAAERLHRHDLAVESYEAALDLGLTGPPRAKAEIFAGEHASVMARLEIRGRAGDRVRVAGIDRGRLPLARPLVLFADESLLEIIAPDGRRSFFPVHLAAGHLDVVDVYGFHPAFVPPPAPAPVPAPPVAAPATPAPPLVAPRAPEPAPGPTPAPWSRAQAPTAPPPEPAAPAPAPEAARHPLSKWLIAGGLGLGVASGFMILHAESRLSTLRGDLLLHCQVLSDGNDACQTADSGVGERDAAQSDVNGIATWKAVRLASWVATGAGLATAAVGVALALSGGGGAEAPAAGRPAPAPGAAAGWSFGVTAGGGVTGMFCTGAF
jgi:hypothetical protein